MEIWRPINGYEGIYEASNCGRIRSLTRDVLVDSKWGAHLRSKRGRILTPRPAPNDYLQVDLSINGSHERRNVHAIIAETFLGPRPNGLVTCHNNGRCADNRETNLRYDTPTGNGQDRCLHGTQPRGENHHAAKLSEADVLAIHLAPLGRGTAQKLAKQYGVSSVQIVNIRSGKSWGHISAAPSPASFAPRKASGDFGEEIKREDDPHNLL